MSHYRMPGVLAYLEQPVEQFILSALGVQSPDLGRVPHPVSQIHELLESGTTMVPW